MDKRIIKWLFKCLTSWSKIFYYKLILENIETIERHNDGREMLYVHSIFFNEYSLNVIIIIINRVSRKKVGLPNSNGGTIEIAQNKKRDPNKWYHKNLQRAIL